MGFKSMKMRDIIFISVAGLLVLMVVFSNFRPKSTEDDIGPPQPPVLPAPVLRQPEAPVPQFHTDSVSNDEDQAEEAEMKGQMERDRNQQRQIKMLKMQLEQVNLQLDNEKALTEINKLKKENAGYVKDPGSQAWSDFPNVRIIYIGGTDMDKEAILSIDGTSYSVREKDKPVANVEVLRVTGQGVKVHFTSPQEATTFINYVQD